MTTTFYRRTSTLDSRIPREAIRDWDDTPTTYYYGTVTLSCEIPEDELDELGLVVCDDFAVDHQAELGALYRAETRGQF